MGEEINLVDNFKVEKVIFNCGEFNELEQDLIKKYNLKDIAVLKVGYYGSKTSSSNNFIDEVNPKYSIISVGKNNRYDHPNDNVYTI